MTHISGNHIDTAQSPRFEAPTFDPRGAFSWTLRAGEVARVERQQRNGLPDWRELESKEPDVAQLNDNERNMAHAPRNETLTFDPQIAFSWTLRSGEIARLERQQGRNRLPDPKQLDARLAA